MTFQSTIRLAEELVEASQAALDARSTETITDDVLLLAGLELGVARNAIRKATQQIHNLLPKDECP